MAPRVAQQTKPDWFAVYSHVVVSRPSRTKAPRLSGRIPPRDRAAPTLFPGEQMQRALRGIQMEEFRIVGYASEFVYSMSIWVFNYS